MHHACAAAGGVLTNLSGATGQTAVAMPSSGPFATAGRRGWIRPGRHRWPTSRRFESRPWYEMIPDQDHSCVTEGYGTLNPPSKGANPYATKSDYVAAGRTPDGKLLLAYMPSLRTLTVDMTKLSGSREGARARSEPRDLGVDRGVSVPEYRHAQLYAHRQEWGWRRRLGAGPGRRRLSALTVDSAIRGPLQNHDWKRTGAPRCIASCSASEQGALSGDVGAVVWSLPTSLCSSRYCSEFLA